MGKKQELDHRTAAVMLKSFRGGQTIQQIIINLTSQVNETHLLREMKCSRA
jgi:hypothetical protein